MTLRELIEKFDPDKELILVDPDTQWLLIPSFEEEGDHLYISGSYQEVWEEKK